MKTFKLDTSGTYQGDLSIENNSFVILEDENAVVQNLKTRLRTYMGEWFLNTSEGVPYYQKIFKKGPDFAVVQAAFKNIILETDGIISLDKYSFEFLDDRVLSLEFTASYGTGSITESIIIEV